MALGASLSSEESKKRIKDIRQVGGGALIKVGIISGFGDNQRRLLIMILFWFSQEIETDLKIILKGNYLKVQEGNINPACKERVAVELHQSKEQYARGQEYLEKTT